MVRRSVLRRAVGWGVVTLGGLGLVFPIYLIRQSFGRAPGSAIGEPFLETVGLLHVTLAVIVGLVLVFVGFGIMADEPFEE